MVYTCKYKALIGDILLAADEIGLTGLWFEGQKYFAKNQLFMIFSYLFQPFNPFFEIFHT